MREDLYCLVGVFWVFLCFVLFICVGGVCCGCVVVVVGVFWWGCEGQVLNVGSVGVVWLFWERVGVWVGVCLQLVGGVVFLWLGGGWFCRHWWKEARSVRAHTGGRGEEQRKYRRRKEGGAGGGESAGVEFWSGGGEGGGRGGGGGGEGPDEISQAKAGGVGRGRRGGGGKGEGGGGRKGGGRRGWKGYARKGEEVGVVVVVCLGGDKGRGADTGDGGWGVGLCGVREGGRAGLGKGGGEVGGGGKGG